MLHYFAIGVALLAAIAIIGIGMMYLTRPFVIARQFGLPLPEQNDVTGWWLRLKGTRDIVSGAVVLAVMAWGGREMLGIVLLVLAFIPLGDMSIVLAGKGSAKTAFSVHGSTAALMILAAIPLITGAA